MSTVSSNVLIQQLTAKWRTNDMYAQILIVSNISKGQMVHVARLDTAAVIWASLRAIHETKDYIAIQRGLFELRANEESDIADHLTQLKQQWERPNVLDSPSFHIPDIQFKTLIASSLPSNWDVFTEPYMGGRIDVIETDPKKLMSSQECIGAIKEEYLRRKNRTGVPPQQTSYASSHSLADRLHNPSKPPNVPSRKCRNCGFTNHVTDESRWLGQPKCTKCGWFGHTATECTRGEKRKGEKNGQKGKQMFKRQKKERTNQATEETTEEVTFTAEEVDGACNFDSFDPLNWREMTSAYSFMIGWPIVAPRHT